MNEEEYKNIIELFKDLNNSKLLKINELNLIEENKNISPEIYFDNFESWCFVVYEGKENKCIEVLNEDNYLTLKCKYINNKKRKQYVIKRKNNKDLVVLFNLKK